MTIGELAKQGFDVNGEILKIWQKYPEITEGKIFPLQYWTQMPLDVNCVIVGFNPSFKFGKVYTELGTIMKRGLVDKSTLNWIGYEPHNRLDKSEREKFVANLFKYSTKHSQDCAARQSEVISKLVERARTELTFYKRHADLSARLFSNRRSWVHLDLFQWHGSIQSVLEDLLKLSDRHREWGVAQTALTLRVLEKCHAAKVIVVANRSARSHFETAARQVGALISDIAEGQRIATGLLTFKNGHRVVLGFCGQLGGFRGIREETYNGLANALSKRLQSK